MSQARAILLLAILAAGALAGCAQPPPTPAAPTPASTTGAPLAERPDTTFGIVETGPAAAPDANATTRAAPHLVRGEWWRIRFSSGFFEDAPELVRVVAHAGSDGYVFGMPHEGWAKEAIAYHAPAFGDVGLDLSYETHNHRFEPLRFPLVKGATWKTTFAASEFTATVERADETTATIRYDPPASNPQPTDPIMAALDPFGGAGGTMRAEYDARQHEIVKFESALGAWDVVAHGYDHEGWVTVPRGLHTAIDHGQFLAATPGEPPVTRTLTVQGGYNRMTILQVVVPLGPGAYRTRAVSPNGTEFVTESIGADQVALKFHETSKPDGAWTLEDVVAGPGATYTMGMAYHQYDVHLPDGAERGDHAHAVTR